MAADWNILGRYFGVPTRAAGAAHKAVQAERGKSTAALSKAKRLAAGHPSITIDRDGPSAYWVTCSDVSPDPYDGGNFHTDGRDVLEAVEAYINAGAKKA